MAYPGTVGLRVQTDLMVLEDVLNSLYAHGFRRILIVNGHGGNSPGEGGWASGCHVTPMPA